jgi:hypothetical protein
MGRRILQRLALVAGRPDDAVFVNDYGADGHFTRVKGGPRLVQGRAHPMFVQL